MLRSLLRRCELMTVARFRRMGWTVEVAAVRTVELDDAVPDVFVPTNTTFGFDDATSGRRGPGLCATAQSGSPRADSVLEAIGDAEDDPTLYLTVWTQAIGDPAFSSAAAAPGLGARRAQQQDHRR
jgi:hypothetical protein